MTDPKLHTCSIRSAEVGRGCGDAIDDCTENEKGEFWVGNDEYGSQVNFCPVCGAKAPTPVPADKYQVGQEYEHGPVCPCEACRSSRLADIGAGGTTLGSKEEAAYVWRSHSILTQVCAMLGIPEKDRVQVLQAIKPAASEEKPFIRVWPFHDAPEALRALSGHGGDEDWLALIPAELNNGHYYGWMDDGSAFGRCRVSTYDLPDGSQVRIGAHS